MNGSGTNSPQPLTRHRWREIVAKYATTIAPWTVKRRHPRYPAAGPGSLRDTHPDAEARWSCAVLELSEMGLTLRSFDDIPLHTEIAIELWLEQQIVLLLGRIRHCTQTVGAYKIGVLLTFDESLPQDNPSLSGKSAPTQKKTPALPHLRRLVVAHLQTRTPQGRR